MHSLDLLRSMSLELLQKFYNLHVESVFAPI